MKTLFCSEAEVFLGVLVAYAADDLLQGLHIIGEHAVFHPLAQQTAQDAAEVLVAGIAEEAAAVGEHAHKAGQITEAGKAGQLIGHTGKVIVEPPGRAVLDLADSFGGLEAAAKGVDGFIVVGVQAVENGLGQLAGGFQCAEESGGLGGGGQNRYPGPAWHT